MAEAKKNKQEEGSVAARAWNATKAENDPEYAAIPNLEFRVQLDDRVEHVRRSGIAQTNFEIKAKELIEADKAAQKDEGPMAVASANPATDAGATGPMAAAAPATAEASTAKTATKKPAAKKTATKKSAAKTSSRAAAKKTDTSGHVASGAETGAKIRQDLNDPAKP